MKNTTILLLFTFAIGFTSFAQNQKFKLGLNLFPNYCLGIVSSSMNGDDGVKQVIQNFETWKPSISASVFVEYQLKENAFLGFGMGYQNNGEQSKKKALVFNIDPTTGQSIFDPSQPSHAKYKYNHHNLEIPVFYRHLFNDRFYGLVGLSGIVNLFNTRTSIYYYTEKPSERNTKIDNSTDFRRLNLSTNIGVGYDLLQKEKFTLYVQPNIQCAILGVSKNAIINRNPISLGLAMGIRL